MRFLYVAPRYHTNQVNIMKGLIEQKDEVCFVSHYKGKTEDYSDIEPVVLGYSALYRLIDFLYVKLIRRKDPNAVLLKVRYGFPPFGKLKKLVREFRPDVAILREKSLYSIAAYRICKKMGCACILYNQSPLWSEPAKTDLAHRIADRFSPKMRMTPVMGVQKPGLSIKENDFYIPFVAKPQKAPEERSYFTDGVIHILCIGKYEVRKHHLELLAAVEKLQPKYPLHLTIIGEASTTFHQKHYAHVAAYVKEHHMESYVDIKANLPRKDMDAQYSRADVYVIPSTGEPASVSQLEAMSFSLPVLCSDENGTACYVEDGVTGYLFQDCNQEDLEKKLELLLSDKERLLSMGAAGYRAVIEKYGFKRYYDGILEIREKIKADGNRS
ncbi:MAG: glycosyltransferase family 4 protein [Bacillus sp. (in: Bacteria)]|nr:glycosyltransferase family 4 protein [Bacillus sp. (in: firmicutes)]MCM1425491.1 glycosyltransferase family 4 protein [Eubacterium sp.]